MPAPQSDTFSLTVNGELRSCSVDPRTPLLEVVREEFGLRGTKYGCGEGECGACTVVVDGKTICSCLATVGSLSGAEVTTVEGLANDPIGVRLFKSFGEKGAVQCGFCIPGFVLSSWQLLSSSTDADLDRIRDGLGGNLCRCTGYAKIIEAVEDLAGEALASPLAARAGSGAEAIFVPQVYWRAKSLDDLLANIGKFAPHYRIIAGGTDLMVQHEHRLHELSLVDISAVPELSGIEDMDGYVRIGATTTWAEIRNSPLIARWAPLLSLAAAEVGAAQIQNRGTIGGNIVNASPAADGLPALYVYGAEVVAASAAGSRVLPVGDFVRGPRRTALEHGEILSEIRVPKLVLFGEPIFFFEKVGPRRAQTITKGSVTFHAWLDGDRLVEPRIALGSVGPTIIRASEAETALHGKLTSSAMQAAARLVSAAASPIDDIRSTAEYRRELVGGLLLRGLLRNVPGLEAPELVADAAAQAS